MLRKAGKLVVICINRCATFWESSVMLGARKHISASVWDPSLCSGWQKWKEVSGRQDGILSPSNRMRSFATLRMIKVEWQEGMIEGSVDWCLLGLINRRCARYIGTYYSVKLQSAVGTGHPLAPTRLANDASASGLTRSDNAAAHLAVAQSEREATASQSGKTQGKGMPLHFLESHQAWQSTTAILFILWKAIIGDGGDNMD
jgi:hypothetical protein